MKGNSASMSRLAMEMFRYQLHRSSVLYVMPNVSTRRLAEPYRTVRCQLIFVTRSRLLDLNLPDRHSRKIRKAGVLEWNLGNRTHITSKAAIADDLPAKP